MTVTMYQSKSGKYKGMWHVRTYNKGRYFHVGRVLTKKEADEIAAKIMEEIDTV